MVSFFRKTGSAGILIAVLAAASLLLAACEQPAGVVRDDDATLRALSVDSGTLSPAFSASQPEYSVTVRNDVETITVNATPNSGKATVSGTGTKTLAVGSITMPVVVNAESGVSKTYTLTVTRLDDSVIEIESNEDMEKIGSDPSYPLEGNYVLINDITLNNWSPIDGEFSGIFDGGNKTITLSGFDSEAVNNKTDLGIFGYVKGASANARARIYNLTINSSVDSSSTAAAGQYIGLVAGRAELAVFENITLTGNFEYTSARLIYLGGAVGQIGAGTVVTNITSDMDMDIKPGVSSSYHWVGGVVGRFTDGAGIESCHVTASITADNVAATGSGQVFVGGITGGSNYYLYDPFATPPAGMNTPDYDGYIQDSSFKGTLIGKAKGYWVFEGGIAGVITGGNVNNIAETTRIKRCFAEGTVSVEGTSSPFPYVGGIVGYIYFGALVSQCYSTATVIGANTGDYTGGISGYNSQGEYPYNSRIEDCWSGGEVKGQNNAGGIVGRNQVNAILKNSYSIAAVSATNGTGTAAGAGAGPGIGGVAGLNGFFTWNPPRTNTVGGKIIGCVALNPSVTAGAGGKAHRVIGEPMDNTTMSNNYARSGLTATETAGAGTADGDDCEEKPSETFYIDLDWDFNNVWIMDTDGYPKLRWQQ